MEVATVSGITIQLEIQFWWIDSAYLIVKREEKKEGREFQVKRKYCNLEFSSSNKRAREIEEKERKESWQLY